MIDNASLAIEQLKVLRGSYIEAVVEFCGTQEIYDYEDLLEVLNPILKAKITQEFIDKKYFGKGSAFYKKRNLIDTESDSFN
jgi:hypothetical protein